MAQPHLSESQAAYTNCLSIHKLSAEVHLGITSGEQKATQKIQVDVRLYMPELLPCAKDDNGEYISYHGLAEKIYALCTAREYRLIEYLGQEIYRLLRKEIPEEIKLWVKLHKLQILLSYVSEGASFTYTDLPPGAWVVPQ